MQFHSEQILWNFEHTTLSIGAEGLKAEAAFCTALLSGRAAAGADNCWAGHGGRARETYPPVGSEGGGLCGEAAKCSKERI